MKDIKNIIFDFGGVILNIHHDRVEAAFRELGVKNFEFLFSQAVQSDLFKNFETGSITPAQFRTEIREMSGLAIDDFTIDITWNKIIGDYPAHRINLLKSLQKHYRLFVLSNTNEIHYKHYISKFREEFNSEFESLFEKAYWSFQIGKRKPDKNIYEFVIEHSGLIPAETLFIDDSLQNIEPANEIGIVGLYLESEVDISSFFHQGVLELE
ncbi:MAG: HAD family phosphatase [Bacteroidales bacterium]|nr:HAD family phosphatase [Bacteroidales bacterium]